MKLGTVSLWCLCCGREMRYYNFISVVVIFPLKKKSVFLFSWTGPVKPDLFIFERSFSRQKSPGSPDGPHKKLSWKHGFVNQFTTSWKAFPPIGFLKPIVCSMCSSMYSWDCLFLGGFGFVTFADRKPTAWLKLDVFSFFPFFRWSLKLSPCTPPSLIYVFENTSAATWRQSSKKFSHFSQFFRASGILFPKFSSISA